MPCLITIKNIRPTFPSSRPGYGAQQDAVDRMKDKSGHYRLGRREGRLRRLGVEAILDEEGGVVWLSRTIRAAFVCPYRLKYGPCISSIDRAEAEPWLFASELADAATLSQPFSQAGDHGYKFGRLNRLRNVRLIAF